MNHSQPVRIYRADSERDAAFIGSKTVRYLNALDALAGLLEQFTGTIQSKP